MPVIAGARAALPLRLSKYLSKAAKKRIPLHRKHGDKNYYKGTGSAKTGHLNSKGRFQVDPSLLPDIVVPDLSEFKLKPYVARSCIAKNILRAPGAIKNAPI